MTIFSNTVNRYNGGLFALFFFLFQINCFANEAGEKIIVVPVSENSVLITRENDLIISDNISNRPYPILQLFRAKQKKNKKITASILAFPFPFGIVGLHRIYLGTAPHVPVVYIGTLGGVLGILPFIDFCVLVLDKDIDRFIENKKVLMWVDENKTPAK